MSSLLKVEIVVLMSFFGNSSSVRSPTIWRGVNAPSVTSLIRSATSCKLAASRPVMTTLAPFCCRLKLAVVTVLQSCITCAKWTAISAPIPLLDPVTIATENADALLKKISRLLLPFPDKLYLNCDIEDQKNESSFYVKCTKVNKLSCNCLADLHKEKVSVQLVLCNCLSALDFMLKKILKIIL